MFSIVYKTYLVSLFLLRKTSLLRLATQQGKVKEVTLCSGTDALVITSVSNTVPVHYIECFNYSVCLIFKQMHLSDLFVYTVYMWYHPKPKALPKVSE